MFEYTYSHKQNSFKLLTIKETITEDAKDFQNWSNLEVILYTLLSLAQCSETKLVSSKEDGLALRNIEDLGKQLSP